MVNKNSPDIIDFVKKTTEAITIISESTKQNAKTSEAIKEMISTQNTANAESFSKIDGKMDGLMTMFKYVILPLITGILALVGIKMIFKL